MNTTTTTKLGALESKVKRFYVI